MTRSTAARREIRITGRRKLAIPVDRIKRYAGKPIAAYRTLYATFGIRADSPRTAIIGTASHEVRNLPVSDWRHKAANPKIKRLPNKRVQITRMSACGNSVAKESERWSSRIDGPSEKPVLKAKKV